MLATLQRKEKSNWLLFICVHCISRSTVYSVLYYTYKYYATQYTNDDDSIRDYSSLVHVMSILLLYSFPFDSQYDQTILLYLLRAAWLFRFPSSFQLPANHHDLYF